jgi:hypothetical protein
MSDEKAKSEKWKKMNLRIRLSEDVRPSVRRWTLTIATVDCFDFFFSTSLLMSCGRMKVIFSPF